MIRIVFAVAFALLTQPAAAQVPADALKELAPTGKLRAAINYGNSVLAQKGPDGEPRGVSTDFRASWPSASACRSSRELRGGREGL